MDVELIKAIGLYIVIPICSAVGFSVFMWAAFSALKYD
jgi:hypothetical protein